MTTLDHITQKYNLPVAQKRAALYIRVSTKKQEDGYSREFQREQGLRHCQEQGYLLDTEKHIFEETHTGIEYRERPILSAMRQAAYHHEFDVLVIYCHDRLARNRTHQAIIREDLHYHGITIETLKKDDYEDDDSIAGEIIRLVRGYLAEEEHGNIARRTRDGILTKLQTDKKLLGAGKALYGYKWNGRGKESSHYVYNETVVKEREDGFLWTEGKVVTYIHLSYDNGASMRQIIDYLDNEGIPTPEGKLGWSVSTIRWILTHPFYTGKAEAFKWHWEKIDGKLIRTLTPESERIPLPDGLIPPLVDIDVFERNQQHLVLNKQFAARRNKDAQDSLLRCGFVKCGYCGAPMVVTRRPNGNVYRCRRKQFPNGDCKQSGVISIRLLDTAVWEYAKNAIRDPSFVALEVEKRRQQRTVAGELAPINRRDQRLNDIEQEIQNLVKLGQTAPFESVLKTIGGLLAGLDKEKSELETQRQQVLSIDQQYKREEETLTAFEKQCAMWRKRIDEDGEEPPYEFKRDVLAFFGIKAHVWRSNTTRHYEITCTPPSIVSNTPLCVAS